MSSIIHIRQLNKYIDTQEQKVFVLCDSNSYKHCFHILQEHLPGSLIPIKVKTGESQKNLVTCTYIWEQLIKNKAQKDAVLINLGGGVISDIGGFSASTYKRGISYYNIPTTLLAMVDAAIGGKTGFNFGHLKNIIGVIQNPEKVVLHPGFLESLPERHIINGFTEMIKHALIDGQQQTNKILSVTNVRDYLTQTNIFENIRVKQKIVHRDLHEKDLRKILNLGHTIGHAIEYAALKNKKKILHGEAVAWGLIVMLRMSVAKLQFNQSKAEKIIDFIKKHYSKPAWLQLYRKDILAALIHDKKNTRLNINMVLLKDIGDARYNVVCTNDEIGKIWRSI